MDQEISNVPVTPPSIVNQLNVTPISAEAAAAQPGAAEPQAAPAAAAPQDQVQSQAQSQAPAQAQAQDAAPEAAPPAPVAGPRRQLRLRVDERMRDLDLARQQLSGSLARGPRAQAIIAALKAGYDATSGGWEQVSDMGARQLSQWLSATEHLRPQEPEPEVQAAPVAAPEAAQAAPAAAQAATPDAAPAQAQTQTQTQTQPQTQSQNPSQPIEG